MQARFPLRAWLFIGGACSLAISLPLSVSQQRIVRSSASETSVLASRPKQTFIFVDRLASWRT